MIKNIFILICSFLSSQLLAKPNIYIGGCQKIGSFERATIWRADNKGAVYPSTVLGEDSKDSSITCITSIGDKLYCLGTEKIAGNDQQVLWILKQNTNDVEKFFLESTDGEFGVAPF